MANGAHVRPANDQGVCGPTPQSSYPLPKCTDASTNSAITLTGLPLLTPVDPDHSHYPAWFCSYDGGNMDGACHIKVTKVSGRDISGCPGGGNLQYCPYTFVKNDTGVLAPYFNIAEQYGFSNWMFQTHQGPSQQGHLFLFSGTSAPDSFGDTQNFWEYFVAENPNATAAGCTAPANTVSFELPPAPPQTPLWQKGYTPPGGTAGYPCYNHPTLIDLLKPAGITWRYYAGNTTGNNQSYAIWRTPDLIQNICQPSNGTLPGDFCTYAGYTNNVYTGNPGQVLRDLGAGNPANPCNLQQVSWVIPDGSWSDHPGAGSFDAGPSWVAAIVNAVGGRNNDGTKLLNQCDYWQDTVVLVVWDDWGGFYDDVLPWRCQSNGVCAGYPGQPQSAQYVYGFRVPLLAVGAYVKQVTPQGGYVSGTASQGGETPPFVHDFGSILNFIEYAFGKGGHHLGDPGGISPSYPYADLLAPDGPNGPNCQNCTYSLSDFFDFTKTLRPFSVIQGAKYPTSYFLDPGTYFPNNYPADPDDDAIDPQ